MSKSKGKQDSISIKRFKNGGIYIKPSRKNMLQHYDLGGLINPKGLSPYTAGASMLGSAVTGLAGDTTGGAVAGGMLSGAAGGASLGPLGMAGGALLGGVTSLLGSNAKKKQAADLKEQQFKIQRANDNQQFLQGLQPQQQYQPTFAVGGETKKDPKAEDAMKVSPNFVDQYSDLREQVKKGGIDNPEIYQNPDKLSEYYNMLAGEKQGKSTTPTGYQQRYITNFNNYHSKTVGGSYDPNSATLRMLPTGSQWKPVNPASVDTIPSTYKPVNWKSPQPYDMETKSYIKSNPRGNALGGGMIGVGTKTYARGGNIVQPNAELEQGEPYRTPDGNIGQVSDQAPTHEQGGVPLNLPQNTQILGKMVDPLFGKQFKQIGSQLKRAQDHYKKVLDEKPTPLARKTAKMMLDKVQGQYDQLMQRQESMKPQQDQTQNQFPYGGMPLMENGRVSMKYPDGGLSKLEPRPIGLVSDPNAQRPQLAQGNPPYVPQSEQSTPFDWNKVGDIAGTLGSIAPIAYNLGQGLFGKTNKMNPQDYQNPNANQVNSLMANRRYDVSPEIESNRQATANYYQNLRQGAPSQGRYLAGLQTGQISNQRANQDVYSRANNVNNQYKAEQAQTLQGLGQQEATTKLGIQNINNEAQVTKNKYLPTALSQLSELSQGNKLMKGQKNLDTKRLQLFKEMFKGYSAADLAKIFNS